MSLAAGFFQTISISLDKNTVRLPNLSHGIHKTAGKHGVLLKAHVLVTLVYGMGTHFDSAFELRLFKAWSVEKV